MRAAGSSTELCALSQLGFLLDAGVKPVAYTALSMLVSLRDMAETIFSLFVVAGGILLLSIAKVLLTFALNIPLQKLHSMDPIEKFFSQYILFI